MQRTTDQRTTDTDEFPRSEIGLLPAAPLPSNPATVADRMASKTVWTLAITSAAVFMVTLDNLVVTTAIPVIPRTCTPVSADFSGRSTPTP